MRPEIKAAWSNLEEAKNMATFLAIIKFMTGVVGVGFAAIALLFFFFAFLPAIGVGQ